MLLAPGKRATCLRLRESPLRYAPIFHFTPVESIFKLSDVAVQVPLANVAIYAVQALLY
jgi:hypothetical protein